MKTLKANIIPLVVVPIVVAFIAAAAVHFYHLYQLGLVK